MHMWTCYEESYIDNDVTASVNICCIGIEAKSMSKTSEGIHVDATNI